jgi:hypothetical protein
VTDRQTTNGELARSTRVRAILLGGVVPLALAIVATALMLAWIPELPDPIAVHWSGAGPDGFGPAVPFLFLPLGITVLFGVFAVAVARRPAPSGRPTWNQKILVTAALWLSALLSVGIGGAVAVQRGLSDAHEAPDAGPLLALGAGVGLLLAVAGWFLLPPGETVDEAGKTPRPLAIEGDERVSWMRTARLGNTALVVVLFALLLVVAAFVVVLVSGRDALWLALIVLVAVSIIVATNTWWRVVADQHGLLVRGVLGWPRRRIPLDDIRSVRVVDVNPSRDFGGWGWRWGGRGRTGVILRAGKGVEVTRSNDRRFVVTVDDAETCAAVLGALVAQRARP